MLAAKRGDFAGASVVVLQAFGYLILCYYHFYHQADKYFLHYT